MIYLKNFFRFYLWLPVFYMSLLIYVTDHLCWYLFSIGKKTEYLKYGACAQTGTCCQNIGLELPRSWEHRPRIIKWINRYQNWIHNFRYLGQEGRLLVYECRHLSPQKTCSIYPFRPKLCREFPLTPIFGKPLLHKGCGFWFVKRDQQGKFGEKLAQTQHKHERASVKV